MESYKNGKLNDPEVSFLRIITINSLQQISVCEKYA